MGASLYTCNIFDAFYLVVIDARFLGCWCRCGTISSRHLMSPDSKKILLPQILGCTRDFAFLSLDGLKSERNLLLSSSLAWRFFNTLCFFFRFFFSSKDSSWMCVEQLLKGEIVWQIPPCQGNWVHCLIQTGRSVLWFFDLISLQNLPF